MKNSTNDLGRKGEMLAAEYLRLKGHVILDTNWRYSHVELDIVSLHPDGLHFVEVKSRVKSDIDPVENFTKAKQRSITKAANAYLHCERMKSIPRGQEVFFDLITIIFEEGGSHINYYPQVFIPIYT